jgi:hypothetical protein
MSRTSEGSALLPVLSHYRFEVMLAIEGCAEDTEPNRAAGKDEDLIQLEFWSRNTLQKSS